MKILHLLPYVPVPTHFGGALRCFHLLKHMAEHHEVTVLAYGAAAKAQALKNAVGGGIKEVILLPRPRARVFRRLGQFYSLWTSHSYFYYVGHTKGMQRAINECCERESMDIVQTEFSIMGSFDLPSDSVKILDAHNVEYDNFRRMALNGHTPLRSFFYNQEFTKSFFEELDACRRSDAMFVTSERDKGMFDEHLPSMRKFVIPNGVDPEYFCPGAQAPNPFSIVFTGMMGYVPNYDGMLHFLDVIFPLILKKVPQATVSIVGKMPPPALLKRAAPNVFVTGFVDDVRPYVWDASVYVVPLRMGSGTRLKVLEAMAMKKPIVTTTIGCEGIDVRDGESAVIVDEPEAFAEAVVNLFTDSALRKKLTDNGYELVKQQYQWSVVAGEVEKAYQQLVDPQSTGPQAGRRVKYEIA